MSMYSLSPLRPTIYIVDADSGVCDKLRALFSKVDACVKTYDSAEALLREPLRDKWCCLISELHLTGMNGLDLLEQLKARHIRIPTILLASSSDVPTAVRAMRSGAIDFIDKPFVERFLLTQVRQLLCAVAV